MGEKVIQKNRPASIRSLFVVLGIQALEAGPVCASAQTAATGDPGHWIYEYVDVLVARGALGELSPLVQPYRRIDVAAAVLEVEAASAVKRRLKRWMP
jgi:hypothetical protein